MKIIISEQQLQRIIKEAYNYTFDDVVNEIENLEYYFKSFISSLEKHKVTKEHKHPNFPLEGMIKYVFDAIKNNQREAQKLFLEFGDTFIYAFFYRNSKSIDSWHNLYCHFKFVLEREEPEICKHEDDINWDLVKNEFGNIKDDSKLNINEPKKIMYEKTPIYDTFEDAYKFLFELKKVSLDKEFCSNEYTKMFHVLYNTGSVKVTQLRKKYQATKDYPPERSLPSGGDEEKINDFIKKYDNLSDTKFYEFAEKFSNETGISMDVIRTKRKEFISKKYGKLFRPKYDESSVMKDPDYDKAQEIMEIAGEYLNCCKKGYYDCDNDDPPFDFSGPKIYKEPNVKYEPTIKGGNNLPSTPTSGKSGGKLGGGVSTNEQIKRKIKRWSNFDRL